MSHLVTSLCYFACQQHILLELKKKRKKKKEEEVGKRVEKLYGFHGKSRHLSTILLKDFYCLKLLS